MNEKNKKKSEISLRGLLTQGAANQTVGQMQSAAANDFNPMFNQPIQQPQQQAQQGLPAQGMQMGHFSSMANNQQAAQNSFLQRQRQQQIQQQQQQQQMQQAHKQQMMQTQQNHVGIPPTYPQQNMPMSQLANQIAQRPMMQGVSQRHFPLKFQFSLCFPH